MDRVVWPPFEIDDFVGYSAARSYKGLRFASGCAAVIFCESTGLRTPVERPLPGWGTSRLVALKEARARGGGRREEL